MRLTSCTDYELRIFLRMASPSDWPRSHKKLTNVLYQPRFHLAELMQRLERAFYIETLRSSYGGARLTFPAEQICSGEVIGFFEEDLPSVNCCAADWGNYTLDRQYRPELGHRSTGRAFLAEPNRSKLIDVTLIPAAVE